MVENGTDPTYPIGNNLRLDHKRFGFTFEGGRHPIAECIPPPDNAVNQRESSVARCPDYRSPSRLAASASSANSRSNAKNGADCPIKSPMAVRKLSAPVAAPDGHGDRKSTRLNSSHQIIS